MQYGQGMENVGVASEHYEKVTVRVRCTGTKQYSLESIRSFARPVFRGATFVERRNVPMIGTVVDNHPAQDHPEFVL